MKGEEQYIRPRNTNGRTEQNQKEKKEKKKKERNREVEDMLYNEVSQFSEFGGLLESLESASVLVYVGNRELEVNSVVVCGFSIRKCGRFGRCRSPGRTPRPSQDGSDAADIRRRRADVLVVRQGIWAGRVLAVR